MELSFSIAGPVPPILSHGARPSASLLAEIPYAFSMSNEQLPTRTSGRRNFGIGGRLDGFRLGISLIESYENIRFEALCNICLGLLILGQLVGRLDQYSLPRVLLEFDVASLEA